jgi:tetratricopeptide (TPR) repeat protein
LLQRPQKNPEVFQMLGTIYYDQGKFNKAIKTFQRALEIDPSYTDASVGLSIILNDIGRYDEGKKVFQDAKKLIDLRSGRADPYIDEKNCWEA